MRKDVVATSRDFVRPSTEGSPEAGRGGPEAGRGNPETEGSPEAVGAARTPGCTGRHTRATCRGRA